MWFLILWRSFLILFPTGLIAGQDDKLKGGNLLWTDNTFIVENQNARIVVLNSRENQASP